MHVDAWLERAAAQRPDRAAVNDVTYAELHERVTEAAQRLHARGARAGDRVGIALGPSVDFAVALHATWRLGAAAIPIDLRLTPDERPQSDVLVEAALDDGPRDADAPLLSTHDLGATAAVIHTSGTTSAPRAIELTFGNFLWSAIGSSVALGHAPDERWLCALPVSHVGGLSIVVRSAIGTTTALVHERFDAERVRNALMHDDVTLVSVVSTTLLRLLDAGLEHPPTLRCALTGGGPVPPALVRRARGAGVTVSQTYGMTEACSQITTSSPGDPEDDAGPPLFCTRVAIAGDGEVVVSGPTLAVEQPLHTGDLGSLDAAGRLTVTGRKADTIVSGGENVAPQEVEAVLAEHPAVDEAAVVGRPHPAWGEAVVAVVVLRPGAYAGEGELRAHCAARLAGFKVPKEIGFAPALPRTRSGKLRRASLRAAAHGRAD